MTGTCTTPADHQAVADIDPAALAADPNAEITRAVKALRVCGRCGLARHRWSDPPTPVPTPATPIASRLDR